MKKRLENVVSIDARERKFAQALKTRPSRKERRAKIDALLGAAAEYFAARDLRLGITPKERKLAAR